MGIFQESTKGFGDFATKPKKDVRTGFVTTEPEREAYTHAAGLTGKTVGEFQRSALRKECARLFIEREGKYPANFESTLVWEERPERDASSKQTTLAKQIDVHLREHDDIPGETRRFLSDLRISLTGETGKKAKST